MTVQNIGFIGLGEMGGRMCRRLVEAGHRVAVYDVNPAAVETMVERGAAKAGSPKDLAGRSDVILASMPDSPAVEAAVYGDSGILVGARSGSVFVDLSSSRPESTKMIAKALSEKGVAMLDAPVSRGTKGAETGTCSMMIGGDTAVLERCRPILSVIANEIFHIGAVGAGHTIKLLNNILSATYMLITTEAMLVGVKAGLDAEVILRILNAGSGRSYFTERRYPEEIMTGRYNSGMKIRLLYKDVAMCADLANHLGIPAPIMANVLETYKSAIARNLGEEDWMKMVMMMEEGAGVKIR